MKLQILKQKNRKFFTYYFEFASLMLKISFNDEEKTAALMNNINRKLRAAMTVKNTSFIFTELVKDLHKVDKRLRANEAFNNRFVQSNLDNSQNLFCLQQQQQRAAFNNSSRSAFVSLIAFVTLIFSSIKIMNINTKANKKFIFSTKRKRRIRENFCIYCDDKNHYRKNCSIRSSFHLRVIE